jgi:lysophospholipase L1-like esterase
MPRFKHLYAASAIIMLNTVVLFLGLEVATRVLSPPARWLINARKRPFTMEDVIRREPWGPQYLRDHDKCLFLLEPAPYVGFRNRACRSQTINISEEGFRDVPGTSRAQDALKVFVLGGSTALGWGVPDWGTIPAFLQKAISIRKSPREVRVSNLGVAAWQSTQVLLFLTLELKRGEIPDLVIFYGGVNDVGRAAAYGRAGIPVTPPAALPPAPSRFLSTVLQTLRRLGMDMPPTPFIDPPVRVGYGTLNHYMKLSEQQKRELARQTVGVYLENLRLVQKLAHAYHFQVHFFWEPNLFTTQKVLSADEKAIRAEPALAPAAYDDLMRRVNALVREEILTVSGLTYLGDTLNGLNGTVFMDWSHLLPSGNDEVAKAIVREIYGQEGS